MADADRTPGVEGMAFARREAADMAARLVSPLMPHLAEEIHALLNPGAGLVADAPWPEADAALVAAESLTIAVAPDAPAESVIAAAETEPNVARQLAGRRIVKRIHVPGRIVNFVVAP